MRNAIGLILIVIGGLSFILPISLLLWSLFITFVTGLFEGGDNGPLIGAAILIGIILFGIGIMMVDDEIRR